MTGILALWNDCRAGDEAAYEAWYRDEHLPERLGIPGFRRGRRFRRIEGAGPEYFTYYEVDAPEVLTSGEYIARLNDPTPMTRTMMTGVFQNMSRTICRVAAFKGHMRGAFAAVAVMDTAPGETGALLADLAAYPGVARAELWLAADPATGQTEEERLRGGDDRIEACVLVEALDEDTARRVGGEAGRALGAAPRLYRFMGEMLAG